MSGTIRLVRPGNLLLVAAAILLGGALAGGAAGMRETLAALLPSVLLVASFYIWNDMDDCEVDRVNRPGRPIPSGAVSPSSAKFFARVTLVLAFLAGAAAGWTVFFTLALWALLLLLYEKSLKRSGLAGNILVSVVASSCLLLGARLGGSIAAGIAPALFAFFLHLGREIVKDIADMEGDRRGERRTVPLDRGKRKALAVSALPLGLLVLLTPVPFLIGLYDLFYLVIVIAGVDILLAVMLYRCYVRPDRRNFGFFARLLKGQMAVGMMAMYLGGRS